jgi:hypothetical protein
LCYYPLLMWAMLPTFRRHILPPSSHFDPKDRGSTFLYANSVLVVLNPIDVGNVCDVLESYRLHIRTSTLKMDIHTL